MAKKDSAPLTMSVLEQQKQQLVNAFTDLAATMRRAAQEAETMANLMADPSIPNETKTAFQQRNQEFARLLTTAAASSSSTSSSVLPLPAPSTSTAHHQHHHHALGTATTSSNGASPSSDGSPTLGPVPSAIGAASAAPSKKRSRASEGPGAASLVDDDGKKKRKKREPRDPNAPKRPASAYILYQNEVRAKFREEHPELSYRELLPEIAKAWQNLDPVEKQRYQDIVDKGKAVYTVQKKAYDMAHGGSNAASPTTTTASIVPPPTTTLRVPSANAHHPSLMAPLNGGMTPTSSHSHQSSEDEESEDEESEDDQRAAPIPHHAHHHHQAHAHAHVGGAARHYPPPQQHHQRHHQRHQQQDEEDEDEDEEEEEVDEPPMKKYKTQQMTMPPIATV
ncbi:hypothetical protein FRC04_001842 [Tulasnella sp. 424]|nr:hypothetical protein FRC04_001842 [Tulasnella sp. 424]KAG8977625.1 hypothetical protein FRC05_000881 [Tulasnella sp. 425]